MKKFIIIVSLFSFFFHSFSQKAKTGRGSDKLKIDWITGYKQKQNVSIKKVLYDDGENIYALLETDKSTLVQNYQFTVVKFNSDMTKASKKDCKTRGLNFEGVFCFNRQIVIFSSDYTSKNNTLELFAQRLDSELEPDGEPVSLIKLTGQNKKGNLFKIAISNDTTKLAVCIYPDRKSDTKTFYIKVFDDGLNDVYEKNIQIDNEAKSASVHEVKVNNKGETFVLTKVLQNETYVYSLNKYDIQGNEIKTEIETKNKVISDLNMSIDMNGNLQLLLALQNETKGEITQFKNLLLNATSKEPVSDNDYPIPLKLVERINRTQNEGKNKYTSGLSNFFKVVDERSLDDGGVCIVFQKLWEKMGSKYVHVIADGFIVIKTDLKGNFSWLNYIPHTVIDKGGHCLFASNNKLILFYNDHTSNDRYDINKSMKPPRVLDLRTKVSFIMVEFDSSGKMVRKALGPSGKIGANIYFPVTKQTTKDRMFFQGVRNKQIERKRVYMIAFVKII